VDRYEKERGGAETTKEGAVAPQVKKKKHDPKTTKERDSKCDEERYSDASALDNEEGIDRLAATEHEPTSSALAGDKGEAESGKHRSSKPRRHKHKPKKTRHRRGHRGRSRHDIEAPSESPTESHHGHHGKRHRHGTGHRGKRIIATVTH
jgi:hypothetical protein